MADIRIKDLTTTASSTASDDFIAVDGTTNGTRKLNAFSPTFGGNATVTGNLTVSGTTIRSSNTISVDSGNTSFRYDIYRDGAGAYQLGHLVAYGSQTGFGGFTWANLDVGKLWEISNQGNGVLTGTLNVNSTTASTSTSSGALVVSGGVGVAGAIYAGGAITTASGQGFDTPNWRFYQSGSSGYVRDLVNGQMALQFVSGNASTIQVYATGTQDSTTTTSGALVSSGGLGVAGAVNAGTFYGLVDGVTAPATAGGYARIYVDSADGDLKVKFGDGTVKTIATDS